MEELLARLRALDVVDDPAAALAERRALVGHGSGARLLPVADGWLAVSLPRRDDWELVPAWLGVEPSWAAVEGALRATRGVVARDGAVLLGLAVGLLGETVDAIAVRATRLGEAPPMDVGDARVVDLSSLWAGPLCGALLADRGARVTKVESVERPDGARATPAFFERMNRGKERVTVPLSSFADLVRGGDVVIEASRPRALANLGVTPECSGARVWVSITGHGRDANRIAFGDDAAVAGGLVRWDGDEPRFLGDAIADPCTGMVAARAVLDALASGGRWLLDVAMARVAASLA